MMRVVTPFVCCITVLSIIQCPPPTAINGTQTKATEQYFFHQEKPHLRLLSTHNLQDDVKQYFLGFDKKIFTEQYFSVALSVCI